MKALTNTLKKMLGAMAHADAGEYLTIREKNRILSNTPTAAIAQEIAPEPVKIKSASKARHIALYMGSEQSAEVMDYVIETCSRLKNDLTVLTFESKMAANMLLQPYEAVLAEAGINMQVAHLSGEPVPSLARYLRKHPEVAFLACKDNGYLGRNYVNGTQRKNALPVPVVVVATGKLAAQATAKANSKSKSSVA